MSHLPEHKYKLNFQDCLNSIYSLYIVVYISNLLHIFFLHGFRINDKQYTLLSTIIKLIASGNTLFDKEGNPLIFKATIEYIFSTERFEEPLIW